MADDSSDQNLRGRDLVGLGGLLAGCVVVFTGIGLLVDDAAGTAPVFAVVGVFLGITLGAVAFWLRVRAVLRG